MTEVDLVAGNRGVAPPEDAFLDNRAVALSEELRKAETDNASLRDQLAQVKDATEELKSRVEELELQLSGWEGAVCEQCDDAGPGHEVIVNTVKQVHDLAHADGWAVCTDAVCRVVSRFA
jgi:hypothetical protein